MPKGIFKRKNTYTDDEIKFIKENYGKITAHEIALALNRSPGGTKSYILETLKLRLSKEQRSYITSRMAQERRTWSDEQIEFLKNNFRTMDRRIIAKELGKSYHAIKSKIKFLGLTLTKEERAERMRQLLSNWTETDDNRLKEMYGNVSMREITKILGRSRSAIQNRVFLLGIKLSDEERMKRVYETFLSKGRGWNKGLKGTHFSPGSEFKKGSVPHNIKPVGSIALHIDKRTGIIYKQIKIKKHKWVLLHRKVWEDNNGKIPPAMIITFKNGDTFDTRIENLEMITLKENLERNKPDDLYERDNIDSDAYVASMITKNKELLSIIKKEYPELIEIKRQQLKLRREINAAKE